ncbi:hypothetical protein [Mycobacterium persicum]|uniref:hypothetical protein n=1 Tax=Mycobacterium persicum TaxID=1487726 RepID=UPI00217F9630|nr:hypothetical protein [Mycobacterium persicum]
MRLCRKCREQTSRNGGLRRTQAYQGGKDRRAKFDIAERDRLVVEVVERRLTVREAAEQLGCAYKYMDKLVIREAKARGVAKRRGHRGPILCDGWTEGKTRVAVHERSNGACELCDERRAQDMHHRRNQSQSGKWHPANILHLCRLCHVKITADPKWAHEFGFTLWHGEEPTQTPVLYRHHLVMLDDVGGFADHPGMGQVTP